MKPSTKAVRDLLHVMLLGWGMGWAGAIGAPAAGGAPANEIRIRIIQGTVDIFRAGSVASTATSTDQVLRPGDRLRTLANTRITLQWPDQTVVPFDALTEVEILAPDAPDALPGLHLIRGIFSFFHRGKPGRIRIITRPAIAGALGTEFVLAMPQRGERSRASRMRSVVGYS